MAKISSSRKGWSKSKPDSFLPIFATLHYADIIGIPSSPPRTVIHAPTQLHSDPVRRSCLPTLHPAARPSAGRYGTRC